MLYFHITNYLNDSKFIFPHQHGVRKHLSCEAELLELVTSPHNSLNDFCSTDAIFIDFAKTLDTVSHQRLLLKLSELNIDPKAINWIASFFNNREQSVSIEDI